MTDSNLTQISQVANQTGSQVVSQTTAQTSGRSSDIKPIRVVILASGSGSNLQVLIDAMQVGELPIQIVGVITNKADAYAITRAQHANIDVAVLSHITADYATNPDSIGKRMGIKTFERHAAAQLQKWQPDLIILAGFMRVLSDEFISASPAPMINLHPSLLPKYKGLDTHQRVLASDDKHHGCSVHVVTAELDAGQVLTQARLEIGTENNSDALQARVQKLEHKILPWTVLLIAKGVLDIKQIASDTDSSRFLPSLPLKLWFDD